MMQYDDDAEESKVSETKGQKAATSEGKAKSSEESKTSAIKTSSAPKEETLEDIIGSDDEDDLFADDPMAFIERQDSSQADVSNLFADDPKAQA